MKRLLILAGLAGMAVWTGLGAFAWSRLARDAQAPAAGEDRTSWEIAALKDEVETLHADVRALAQGFGESLQALHDELAARQDDNAAALRAELAALRDRVGVRTSDSPSGSDEIANLLRELGRRLDAAEASGPAGSAASTQAPPAAEPEPARIAAAEPEAVPAVAEPEPPSAPARRGSFLAFKLPSDDFRFDERRGWTVLPALSRVGFDAKTTLHDFSGTTSAVAGELECDLSRASEKPKARIVVEAGKLETGDSDRDEAMREHLAVDQHRTLEFELLGFEPRAIDAGDLRVQGTARGTMRIRGVTHEVSMPVTLAVDEARRLAVEGEITLDLEDYGVPVPNRLGLITMEKEVKIWLSLKLRANPRSED